MQSRRVGSSWLAPLLTGPVLAQKRRQSLDHAARIQRDAEHRGLGVIRTDANRVLIPTTVTDSYGRPVQGLHKQDFRLLEDGVEQDLSEFFVEDGPISIGVVLDVSASVRNKLVEAQTDDPRVSRLEYTRRRVFSGHLQGPTRTCARVHDTSQKI